MIKNFLLQNVVRADISLVLWQFLKNAASPAGEPQITRAFPRRRRRRNSFELSLIKTMRNKNLAKNCQKLNEFTNKFYQKSAENGLKLITH
jgi:hypothetical protein